MCEKMEEREIIGKKTEEEWAVTALGFYTTLWYTRLPNEL